MLDFNLYRLSMVFIENTYQLKPFVVD